MTDQDHSPVVRLFKKYSANAMSGIEVYARLASKLGALELEVKDIDDPTRSLGYLTHDVSHAPEALKPWQVVVRQRVAQTFQHESLVATGLGFPVLGGVHPVMEIQAHHVAPDAAAALSQRYGWPIRPLQLVECIARASEEFGVSAPVVSLGDLSVKFQCEGSRLRYMYVESDGGAFRDLTASEQKGFLHSGELGYFYMTVPGGHYAIVNNPEANADILGEVASAMNGRPSPSAHFERLRS